jgi:dTDP-4-amino-4,6-dideoxygalactose transaminase
MSNSNVGVPFNDLTRIHKPLLAEFQNSLERIVLESNFVLGKEVENFEKSLSSIENCKHAICVNSGTSALELALRSCGVGVGDEVITTSLTFVATCFSIVQVGAVPVLVDIELSTGLMNLNLLKSAITTKTKALVFVTLHGRVDLLAELNQFCKDNGLKFIIDAAQSHLGNFEGMPQTQYCDVATLSFYPGKNLGALGEGGAVLTNSEVISERIKVMRDWGAVEKYTHTEWGGNFRLEPIQAAFLSIKIRNLLDWTNARQKVALAYNSLISPILLMDRVSLQGSHVQHIFAITTPNRELFIRRFKELNIGYGLHYPNAIHQNLWYRDRVKVSGVLVNAEKFAERTLSLPIFPEQTEEEIERVIQVVNELSPE